MVLKSENFIPLYNTPQVSYIPPTSVMSHRDFCYWLQGFFELQDNSESPATLTQYQIETIKNHLKLVFNKETPSVFFHAEGSC